jgi:hypothetical protein
MVEVVAQGEHAVVSAEHSHCYFEVDLVDFVISARCSQPRLLHEGTP